jgi:hypothetical protein
VAGAEEVVVGDDADARRLELGVDPGQPAGLEDLREIPIVGQEIGAVQHADIGHVVGEIAGVGDVHHVRPLADHLVHVLARAELLARKDVDGDPPLRALAEVLREELGGQMGRLCRRERMRQPDGIVGGTGLPPGKTVTRAAPSASPFRFLYIVMPLVALDMRSPPSVLSCHGSVRRFDDGVKEACPRKGQKSVACRAT